MKGLDLTRAYALEVAQPQLERRLGGDALPLLAWGSVGDGSDRFGFDDEISRDHDWGVALCIWAPDAHADLVARVDEAMSELSASYRGFPVLGFHVSSPAGRAGAFTVGEHYRRFTGFASGPALFAEWRAVDEHALAAATNGEVFFDGSGAFTAVRERLLQGYPEPVRTERVADACFAFAQTAQYNLIRAVLRRDTVACRVAYARAHEAACRLVHTLSGRYCPYYKWMQSSLVCCGETGEQVAAAFAYLAEPDGPVERLDAAGTKEMVEAMGEVLVAELAEQGFTEASSPYLLDHVGYLRALVRSRSEKA